MNRNDLVSILMRFPEDTEIMTRRHEDDVAVFLTSYFYFSGDKDAPPFIHLNFDSYGRPQKVEE